MKRLALTLLVMGMGGLAYGFESPGAWLDENALLGAPSEEAVFTPRGRDWLVAPMPADAEAASDDLFLLQPKGDGTFPTLAPEVEPRPLPAPNMLAVFDAPRGGSGILPVLGGC